MFSFSIFFRFVILMNRIFLKIFHKYFFYQWYVLILYLLWLKGFVQNQIVLFQKLKKSHILNLIEFNFDIANINIKLRDGRIIQNKIYWIDTIPKIPWFIIGNYLKVRFCIEANLYATWSHREKQNKKIIRNKERIIVCHLK